MTYLSLPIVLLLAYFLAFMPRAYAQRSVQVEAAPLAGFVQTLPPIIVEGPRVQLEIAEIEAIPDLKSEYIYNADWTKAIKEGGYLRADNGEYFKEARRGMLYGDNYEALKGKLWEDEDEFLNDKNILREKWRQLVGFDIFYPYFKAKQLERWAKEKFSVRLFGMKGRPQFKKNKLLYVFKTTF